MKLVGERRALAATVMVFYFLIYLVVAIQRPAPELTNMLLALAGVYGLAFFSLVAGYFWARWYAIGVGIYGIITAVVGMWQLGTEPVLLFIGGTHLGATLLLWGQNMAQPFDGQTAWREKWHMDDNAVQRLGRSVIRAGVSLPFILLYAFAPRDGATTHLLAVAALVLAGVGLRALVRMKTWGVIAMGAAGTLLLAQAAVSPAVTPAVAGGLLLAATAPFAGPMTRFLAAR
ncbi:MAG: hypothetical protein KF773_15720 [Deltaproteobacteria bacterium]|nr:hypothetical protein [Deltaproteobacteria bacterium]MCW5802631.1 hypothetical protein [Deltaproteobacteria bacterium]